MREIKFRGIAKHTGKWAFGYFTKFNCGVCWINNYIVQEDTVGQYTGLKDKNGVEIYEGDIVRVAWDTEIDIKGVICFGEADVIVEPYCGAQILGYYVEIANGREENIIKQQQGDKLSLFSSDIFEVIGNIHDNPELLEVEE